MGGPRYPDEAGYSNETTSRNAAHSIRDQLGKMRRLVYDVIAARGPGDGLTDEEVEGITGMRHQSASARRRELVLKGWLRDSGRTRMNNSGRPAIVWELEPAGGVDAAMQAAAPNPPLEAGS